jgi:hypothetical protein
MIISSKGNFSCKLKENCLFGNALPEITPQYRVHLSFSVSIFYPLTIFSLANFNNSCF